MTEQSLKEIELRWPDPTDHLPKAYGLAPWTDVYRLCIALREAWAEIERLKRDDFGDFTAEEIEGFCNRLKGMAGREAFRKECDEYRNSEEYRNSLQIGMGKTRIKEA